MILAREVPCGFRSVRRSTVADFLAIDRLNGVPIVAEAKCATTTDSLTGVLLELLVQWCLHKSAMTALRQQFLDDGENVSDLVTQPGASIVAPASFYRETRRRSADRGRRGEITHAVRMLKLLHTLFRLSLELIEVDTDWAIQRRQSGRATRRAEVPCSCSRRAKAYSEGFDLVYRREGFGTNKMWHADRVQGCGTSSLRVAG